MSGREPSTWILREPGIGRVTDPDSCSVCCSRELGTAFMAFVLGMSRTKRRRMDLHGRFRQGAEPGGTAPPGDPAKLPYAGITRIRFEGSVSTGRWPVPPLRRAFDHDAAAGASRPLWVVGAAMAAIGWPREASRPWPLPRMAPQSARSRENARRTRGDADARRPAVR